MSVFYAAGPAGRSGPMSADELLAEVVAGRLPDNVPVWWPEAPDWTPLPAHPELASRLQDMRRADAGPPEPNGGAAAAAVSPERNEELDRVFAGIVESSWKYHRLLEDTRRVDEVLVGAMIAATLDSGRALIDITSDGTNHFLRFEDPVDRSRASMAITHLTRDVTTAKAVGQRAAVTIAYGEAITRFGQVIDAMRKEAKSGYIKAAEPGIVTFDKEEESKYLYAQVDLFLDLDEYIDGQLKVDYDKLATHVEACVHALRRFLRGRIEES